MPASLYEQRYGSFPGETWMVNYDADRALCNFHYLAALMESPASGCWPRVFASRDCAAIVVATTTLDALRDPHVMAWRDSFFELDRAAFLRGVEECMNGRRRYLGERKTAMIAA